MDPKLYTPLETITQAHDELDASFRAGKTLPIAVRKKQLARLAYMLKDNFTPIQNALSKDLHRPVAETVMSGDFGGLLQEVVDAYNNIESWTKDINAPTTLTFKLMNTKIKPSPKGVVLIIAPFNYPLLTSLIPAVGALTAGCTVVIKFSELLGNLTPLIANLIAKYLDPEIVRVVHGSIPETQRLLELQWDHIFFTGSPTVGRIVATAAAKHLTPVTLELGGKCPVVVDPEGADMTIVARRILWGRSLNAGQACVSPEYVLVPRSSQNALEEALKAIHNEFWPEGALESESLGRIVNERSYNRLSGYIQNTNGRIITGNKNDGKTHGISPTVVADVKGDDATMKEEMFGPILAIIPVDSLDDAIAFINARPNPLALYVFSHNADFKRKIAAHTRSGSIVYNDTMLQVGVPGLPFGGSGESGYGAYTGKYSFDTFTHFRSSLDTPIWLERLIAFRYPPYTPGKIKMAKKAIASELPFNRNGESSSLTSKAKWIAAIVVALTLVAYSRNKDRIQHAISH